VTETKVPPPDDGAHPCAIETCLHTAAEGHDLCPVHEDVPDRVYPLTNDPFRDALDRALNPGRHHR
jgi:hypothetical protein